MLSGNSLRQTVHTHCASVHQAAKLVAALLRVAGVTAGLAESNGSLPSGLWLTSLAGWLPRTRISSGTLSSVIEYLYLFTLLTHSSVGDVTDAVCCLYRRCNSNIAFFIPSSVDKYNWFCSFRTKQVGNCWAQCDANVQFKRGVSCKLVVSWRSVGLRRDRSRG